MFTYTPEIHIYPQRHKSRYIHSLTHTSIQYLPHTYKETQVCLYTYILTYVKNLIITMC